MSSFNNVGTTVAHRPGEVYPTPRREGIFERNVKNGVKYADAKTKARQFDLDKLSQAYNPNRFVHVTAADALIDPHVTIRHERIMPTKDPGYATLGHRNQVSLDKTRRVIQDYNGTPIIKVDQEGGIFDAQLGQGSFKINAVTMRDTRNKSHNFGGARASRTMHPGGGADHVSTKFLDLQNSLQTIGKLGKVRDVSDLDSTLSTRGLMQRKLYLMK